LLVTRPTSEKVAHARTWGKYKERQTTNIERSKTMFGLLFYFDKN
jgi:hypothetical protein